MSQGKSSNDSGSGAKTKSGTRAASHGLALPGQHGKPAESRCHGPGDAQLGTKSAIFKQAGSGGGGEGTDNTPGWAHSTLPLQARGEPRGERSSETQGFTPQTCPAKPGRVWICPLKRWMVGSSPPLRAPAPSPPYLSREQPGRDQTKEQKPGNRAPTVGGQINRGTGKAPELDLGGLRSSERRFTH